MLNQDEARARLDAVHDPDWVAAMDRRVKALPKADRSIAERLLGGHAQGAQNQAKNRAGRAEAGRALDQLDHAHRTRIFTALHPQQGEDLAWWWQAMVAQPYTVGSARRAFRAPNNPELTAARRADAVLAHIRGHGSYPRDVAWLAGWAGFLHSMDGSLLASTIEHNPSLGEEVFDTLVSVVRGDHPVGVIGRATIVGLLRSPREDGWELVEGLLLAAQRQEGLRQVILESVDEARLDAFIRMLRFIVDNDLLRFAAAVRAVGVWLGNPFDVAQTAEVRALVDRLLALLTDEQARAAALSSDEPIEVYVSLVTEAIADAVVAVVRAKKVALDAPAPCRAAAALFLGQAGIDHAQPVLVELLDDDDLTVAWHAFQVVMALHYASRRQLPADAPVMAIHEPLIRLIERMPAEAQLEPVVFEHLRTTATRATVVVSAMHARGDRPLDVMLAYFDLLDSDGQASFARVAMQESAVSADVRRALLRVVAGRGSYAQSAALEALAKFRIGPDDAPELEALLTRKAAALRQGLVALLSTLGPDDRVASSQRLWDTGNAQQRDAACELLADVDTPAARTAKAQWSENATERQRELLGIVDEPAVTLAAIYDPQLRTPAQQPKRVKKPTALLTETSAALPGLVDDIVEQYKDTEVEVANWQGSTTMLLADVRFVRDPLFGHAMGNDDAGPSMMLGDVFRSWWADRPESDGAGDHAARALVGAMFAGRYRPTSGPASTKWAKVDARWRTYLGHHPGELRHPALVRHVLAWLAYETATAAVVDDCLHVTEHDASKVKRGEIAGLPRQEDGYRFVAGREEFRRRIIDAPWHVLTMALMARRPELFDEARLGRLWALARWVDQPAEGVRRLSPPSELVTRAFETGVANRHDLIADFMEQAYVSTFRRATSRRRSEFAAQHPEVTEVADQLRDVAVAAELARGDLPTDSTEVVRKITSVEGADLAMALVSRLGTLSLARGYLWGTDKKGTISHLIRVCYPAADDTAETLSAAAERHGVKQRRMVEFGVYAPQWAALVEQALGWPGFEDAVWWIHAHTKDNGWRIDAELRETWAALSAERTPLSSESLIEGAVDVDWFWRVQEALGAERWTKVYKAGKFAAGGSGHRRAQIFADALRGQLTEDEMVERIVAKRHQDTVRGLGLLPLPDDRAKRQDALLHRYQVLREFERGSSKFGSQRQTSERTAVRIGIENLARNAGYGDPLRFSWAMEADELADLAAGPLVVTDDDLTVTLRIDDEGVAQLDVDRAGKTLKAVPAKKRKQPDIAALRDRKTQLAKQVRRVRGSLESSLVAGDPMTAGDLADLQRHPIVAPMLRSLVLLDEAGVCMRPVGEGFADVDGAAVTPEGTIRIAHPADLLASGRWSSWQGWCFTDSVRQPFKQVFRELYVPTATELADGPTSARYSGHQVQPRQAQALFTSRTWNVDHDSGTVSRVFHHADLVARVDFVNGFLTPAEVELPTVGNVWFTRRGEWLALPLDTVPPRVFSEAMRDVDLVVAVAHAGGVDPEASASTVEMRTALAREMATVMGLDNVEFVGNHAVISGALGEYSLHLGSGVVHRRPGGSVCIVPVHAQRRGRLFLPFADDDPKTAEIMSKLLLFGRDDQIKDPTILEQLRA